MGRAEGQQPLIPSASPRRAVAYTDAEGRATDDPAAAVRGEIVEYDAHGRRRHRMRFFLSEHELAWLPVSEPAFLLWVLIVLMAIWLVIGFVLLT
jgi:hypothetical protein